MVRSPKTSDKPSELLQKTILNKSGTALPLRINTMDTNIFIQKGRLAPKNTIY